MSKKNLIGVDDKPKKRRLTLKQKIRKRGPIAGVSLLIVLGITWMATRPSYGTAQYALCRVFAERQLYYPQSMQIISVDHPRSADTVDALSARSTGAASRMWEIRYTFSGPFGEERSNILTCKTGTDQAGQPYIISADMKDSSEIGAHPVDPDILTTFNMTVPAILAAKPDRALPPTPKDDLLSLRPDDGGDDD